MTGELLTHTFPESLGSVAVAADLAGVTTDDVYRWIGAKRLRPVRLNGVEVVRLDLVRELAEGAR